MSGASIAGPALAFWLHRHGLTPTVVERAPELRAGGQTVDLRGAGRTVIERMGLVEAARERVTHEDGPASGCSTPSPASPPPPGLSAPASRFTNPPSDAIDLPEYAFHRTGP